LIGALALAGAAYGQVPSSNDTSDTASGNTGMGSGALGGPSPASLTGKFNTASGYQALFSNTTGSANTADGYEALHSNTGGFENTASGPQALYSNTTGSQNTADGYAALYSNTTGSYNTASGASALIVNTTGADNSAFGFSALTANTTGNANTATGHSALYHNTSGAQNTADGVFALLDNTAGTNNTAAGFSALSFNTTGLQNAAFGTFALYSNVTGTNNTAAGYEALFKNKGGTQNTALRVEALYSNAGSYSTAVGYQALHHHTSGAYNGALGWKSGFAVTTGSNTIDIDNQGQAGDSDTIRIGTQGTQTNTSIAGIYNNTAVSGLVVVVDSTGQLGVAQASSERFKTAIVPMGSNTAKLAQLRPVTFKYKTDPQSTLRYGLIAEEVAKVYPELVIRNESGRIDGVRYDELAPMLLNEVQQQQRKVAVQSDTIASMQHQLTEIHAALLKVQTKDELVAQR
jgi:hypothetical protein